MKDYEDDIITNGGAENCNGQIKNTIVSHPSLGLFLKALYDFDTSKFLKIHNDSIKQCHSNCKSHFTPKQAKAKVNNLIPQGFIFKPKPKRPIHKWCKSRWNYKEIKFKYKLYTCTYFSTAEK